jgi:hypothetical protein
MNASTLGSFLSQTMACAGQMVSNAYFIQKELPNLEMPDEIRSQISSLCDDLIGTRFDLKTEVDELYEKVAEGASDDLIIRLIKGKFFFPLNR